MRSKSLGISLLLFAVSSVACGGAVPTENDESQGSDLFRVPVGPITTRPPIVFVPPTPPTPPAPPVYVGDANDPDSVKADADAWYQTYFTIPFQVQPDWTEAMNVAHEADTIRTGFDPMKTPDFWNQRQRTSGLVQMYDLMAPIDPVRAGVYLERLRAVASAFLDERDDNRHLTYDQVSNVGLTPSGQPWDYFRQQVMPAWGALTEDRDGNWNTDVSTSAIFVYAMAAFARRVADNPALQGVVGGEGRTYAEEAIRFTTAAIETYEGFRPELYLDANDPEATFNLPLSYKWLVCTNGDDAHNSSCQVYRDTAGQALAWNENLSMMKMLAELSLASDSALYRSSGAANPRQLALATTEAPVVVAKSVQFFVDNLQTVWVDGGSDGIVATYQWNHQKPTARIQDTGHANFELASLGAIYEDKPRLDALIARNGQSQTIPITLLGLSFFANTLLHRIIQVDSSGTNILFLDTRVDGGRDHSLDDNANSQCAGFIPLTHANYWVWKRCRDATFVEPSYVGVESHAALLRYRQYL